jgi:hypothetical protein
VATLLPGTDLIGGHSHESDGQGRREHITWCDVSRMALLSHFPLLTHHTPCPDANQAQGDVMVFDWRKDQGL